MNITKLAQEIQDYIAAYHSGGYSDDWMFLQDLLRLSEQLAQAVINNQEQAKAEQREKFAKMCDAKAKRAKEHHMFPAFCLNAVAETAEEIAKAIREEK